MKELLNFLVTNIVNKPEDIVIEEQIPGEGFLNLALHVNKEDAGLIIGKSGRTIKSLKDIVKILALRENKRVNIELTNEKRD